MASKQVLKFGPAIKELRLHLCQKSAASQGVREFVETHYVPLKLANPKFPVLVRECSGIHPTAWARFGFGREASVDLSGKTGDEVYLAIAQLEQS
jgi:NADH dehydrogenase (ubiquinone) 1 alpha subcomplex subunit 2